MPRPELTEEMGEEHVFIPMPNPGGSFYSHDLDELTSFK